jgi:hypothetical protein
MFGHRLSHLTKLIRNLNHHLRHRSSMFGHFDSLFYQIFGEMSSMRATLASAYLRERTKGAWAIVVKASI